MPAWFAAGQSQVACELQPGNRLPRFGAGDSKSISARSVVKLCGAHAWRFLDDPGRLAGYLGRGIGDDTLPEREPHQDVYASFAHLLALDSAADWRAHM